MIWTNIKRIDSSDKNVSKFVFTKNDAIAESVLYKYPDYLSRTVICCSTQSGCPVGCRFCGSGDNFIRSLTWQEIVAQPEHLLNEIPVEAALIRKLQIMFMSMGEPMLNYFEVKKAIQYLYKKYYHAQLLISTSAPASYSKYHDDLVELSENIPTVGLQFSVHESTDEARRKLIPTKTLSLKDIAFYGIDWATVTKRKPFFNYCVHNGNNSNEDALRLSKLFHPNIWECTLSVVCERDENVAAANERQRELVNDFMIKMLDYGFSCRVFDPAGQEDIGGGCGMLWFVQKWMAENPQYVKPSKGFGLPKIHAPA